VIEVLTVVKMSMLVLWILTSCGADTSVSEKHTGSASRSTCFTLGGWSYPRASPVVMENRIIPVPAGNRTPAVQSVSSHSPEVSRHIKETMMDDNF
jgi:hypothetical protein